MKRIFNGLGVALVALSFLPSLAFAQGYPTMATSVAMPISTCISLGYNLRVGATDASTGGFVTSLQVYLMNAGFFNAAYMGTGRFGPITANAVARFQASQGLPSTGYVGPLTRALLQKITCGGSVVVPPVQGVWLTNLSPMVGQAGTSVTISGSGFTNSNTILMDGSVVATNVALNPTPAIACSVYDQNCIGNRQSITFSIPPYIQPYCAPGMYCAAMVRQVSPGPYSITVQNSNGTSNAVTFQVVSNTNADISINGLDAPTSLTIGQQGTWTVRVLTGRNTGNIRYSVLWGDESQAANASIMAPQDTSVQSSATFTHTYRVSGTYRPAFTVTQDGGGSASVSTSILVNPIY